MYLLPQFLSVGNLATEPGTVRLPEPLCAESARGSEMGGSHRARGTVRISSPSGAGSAAAPQGPHSSRAAAAALPALAPGQWCEGEGGLSPAHDWGEGGHCRGAQESPLGSL